MNDLLVVLNPRRIAECNEAIDALSIDKLWLQNYSEAQIQDMWPEVLEASEDYERLFILSDDTIPRPKALRRVRSLLNRGHPVVTGYCNLDSSDARVNVCKAALGAYPAPDAYPWRTFEEMLEYPQEVVPTTFVGFCLTCMSWELWKRFPYRLHDHGNSADFQLSKRLTAAKVPMVAHRDAFVMHVKEQWCFPDKEERKKLLVGIEPAEMRLEQMAVAV